MAIACKCTECGQTYNLADTMVGKTVRCKNCSATFPVRELAASRSPEPAAAPSRGRAPRDEEDDRPRRRRDEEEDREEERSRKRRDDPDEDDRSSRRKARGDEEEDRPSRRSHRDDRDDRDDPDARRRDEDDYEDDRPRRKSKSKKGGSSLMLWLGIGGGGFLVLIIGVVLLVLLMGGSNVTKANFDKLKNGMSEAEVIAILGRPDRKQGTDELNKIAGAFGAPKAGGGLQMNVMIWESGKNTIAVTFLGGRAASFAGSFTEGSATTRIAR